LTRIIDRDADLKSPALKDAMTMNQRTRTTGLIVAFILASAALPATAAPAPDDAQEVVRIRAAIAANADKALEKQGGSRILFKVDADALHEEMVTDLRDDLYRILREGRIPFAGLARSGLRTPRTSKGS
jgi:preprotein translocase subunit SecD